MSGNALCESTQIKYYWLSFWQGYNVGDYCFFDYFAGISFGSVYSKEVMKKLIFTLQVIFLAFSIKGQNSKNISAIHQHRIVSDLKIGDMIVDLEPGEALKYYLKAYQEAVASGDSISMGQALVRIGDANYTIGSYGEALAKHSEALAIYKKLSMDSLEAQQLSKIGSVYYFSNQGELELALKYFEEAFSKFNSLNMREDAALNLNFSGYIEWARGNKQKSLEVHKKALDMFSALNDQKGIATALSDIGFTLNSIGAYKDALEYHFKALGIERELNDEVMQVPTLNNIGISYQNLKNYQLALKYSLESLVLAEERQLNLRIVEATKTLSETYELMGDARSALQMQKKFKIYSDSLNSLSQIKKLTQQSMLNEFENTKAQMRLEEEKREALRLAEIERQKLLRNGLIAIIVLGTLLALMLYRGYHLKNKSHEELSRMNGVILSQKFEVEQKNQDITDSIKYAKRLQDAILPREELMKTQLGDVMVYYRPKDIVSGDFYWLEIVDNTTFIAVADCTGHGIPGAMVSMVCYSALTRSIREFQYKMPNEILNNSREMIVDTFEGGDHEVYDGMAISLCCIDRVKKKFLFSGAHNPIYHITKESISNGTPELKIISADKQPVGNFPKMAPFTCKDISVESGDLIYLFTDGFVDQFGGERNEKFKYRRFRNLLLEICHKPLSEQKKELSGAFNHWKGNLEQIDDVCVMAFKV